jgi:tRNA(adenine34) deaminase
MGREDSAKSSDELWMRVAIEEAHKGESAGEVPVGAVIVNRGALVAAGHNSPVAANDPTAHAEINALRAACSLSGNYRLDGATIYVTLEPCAMCAGALVHARLARVVFGVRDLRFGGAGSKFQIADSELLNHRMEISEGVLGADCLELLQRFFSAKRSLR